MADGVVKSAARVLALFEHLRTVRTPIAVSEVASALDMPQSSASVLLKSLRALGYLVYDVGTRRYRATYRVALLGDWLSGSSLRSGPLADAMDAIGYETGETVLLGQQVGPRVQYVHIVPAKYPVRLHIPVGTERPMTCAATGMALLALKPDREVRLLVRRNNAEADKVHRVVEARFMEEIARVRRRGYAATRGNMTPGAAVIAMAVPAVDESPPLALGIGGTIERVDANRERLIATLREHLGAPPCPNP